MKSVIGVRQFLLLERYWSSLPLVLGSYNLCNIRCDCDVINLLKPTGYAMHQQFNIQQLYILPELYLCFVFI